MPEDENNDTQEYEYVEHKGTNCDHYYGYAPSDPNSNLVSIQCTRCWHGVSIDGESFEIKDGKIVKKDTNES